MLSISHLELLVGIFTSLLASSGFWVFLTGRAKSRDLSQKLLVGLAHDRIVYLCEKYIERGSITHDEYENLKDFLYKPYLDMGGNGAAARLMKDVDQLPILQRKNLFPNRKDKDVPK